MDENNIGRNLFFWWYVWVLNNKTMGLLKQKTKQDKIVKLVQELDSFIESILACCILPQRQPETRKYLAKWKKTRELSKSNHKGVFLAHQKKEMLLSHSISSPHVCLYRDAVSRTCIVVISFFLLIRIWVESVMWWRVIISLVITRKFTCIVFFSSSTICPVRRESEWMKMERKMNKTRVFTILSLVFAFSFDLSNALYGSSSPVLQLTPSNFKSKVLLLFVSSVVCES